MTELNQIDLRALAAGNKRAWDAFVAAAAPLINAVVRRTLATYRLSEDDVMDAAQDVFVRLCANDFRLLKTYDPARAGLSTWLAVVARSAAVDHSHGAAGRPPSRSTRCPRRPWRSRTAMSRNSRFLKDF